MLKPVYLYQISYRHYYYVLDIHILIVYSSKIKYQAFFLDNA
jgi:hypothetical protein